MKTGVSFLTFLITAILSITLFLPGPAKAETETRIAVVYTGNILGRVDEKAG